MIIPLAQDRRAVPLRQLGDVAGENRRLQLPRERCDLLAGRRVENGERGVIAGRVALGGISADDVGAPRLRSGEDDKSRDPISLCALLTMRP
jgi:hypothetical protein